MLTYGHELWVMKNKIAETKLKQTHFENVLGFPRRNWRKEKAREKDVWDTFLSLLPL